MKINEVTISHFKFNHKKLAVHLKKIFMEECS